MKETSELTNSIFDTAAQGIESLADGFQFGEDLPAFFDEALAWPEALRGLENLNQEARAATPAQVDTLFAAQREKLLRAGMHPMLAGSIESGLKSAYFTYATIVQTGGEAVSDKHRKAYEVAHRAL